MSLVKCKVCKGMAILESFSGVDKKNWTCATCAKAAMPVEGKDAKPKA